MAASVFRRLGSCRNLTFCAVRGYYRTFLSNAYRCDDLWDHCRDTKGFQNIKIDHYGMELHEKFEVDRSLAALDVEIFFNKITELAESSKWLPEDLIYKFRHSDTNYPVLRNITHPIIRGYLQKGWTDKLVEMMRNRISYGIFPEEYGTSLLIDELLKMQDYKNAAYVATEVMLQEEYDHPISTSLSLTAAVNYYYHNDGFYKPEPLGPVDEDDIEYIPVKVVHNQYYDDHFDITDEQFLIGKTIYKLAQFCQSSPIMPEMDVTLANSLQLLGLGMYNKFKLADQQLEIWGGNLDSAIVDKYLEYFMEAPTRPDEIPDKPPSQRTMFDEYELKMFTEDEKATLLENLTNHMERHTSEFKTISNIEKAVENYTQNVVKLNESNDIDKIKDEYSKWRPDRERQIDIKTQEFVVAKKKAEIQEKLQKLQEKEELLSYFQHKADILLKTTTDFKKKAEEETMANEEEVYVHAPGERNVKAAKIKKRN